MDSPESISNHDIIIVVGDSRAKNLKLLHPGQGVQPHIIYICQNDIIIDNIITLIDKMLLDYASNNVLVVILSFHSEFQMFLPPNSLLKCKSEYIMDIVDKISVCSANWRTLYPMCYFVWCLPYIPDFKRYNNKLHIEDYVPYTNEDILEIEQVRIYCKLVNELKKILENSILPNTQVLDLNFVFTDHISDREKYFENFVNEDKLPEFATGVTSDGLHPLPALSTLFWKQIFYIKSKFCKNADETNVIVEEGTTDKQEVAMGSYQSIKGRTNINVSNSLIPLHVKCNIKKFIQIIRRNAEDKVLSITKIPFRELEENAGLELNIDDSTYSNISEIDQNEDSCTNASITNHFPAKGFELKNKVDNFSNCFTSNEISEVLSSQLNDVDQTDLGNFSLRNEISESVSSQQNYIADLGNCFSENEICERMGSEQNNLADLSNFSSRKEGSHRKSLQQNNAPESSSKKFRYKKKQKKYNILTEIKFENCFDIYSKLIVKDGSEYSYVTPTGKVQKMKPHKVNEFKRIQAFYQSSIQTINTIMKIHRERTGTQSNIVLVTDDRENFDVSLAGYHKRVDIMKIQDLSFLNAFTSIQKHPNFGKGTIFIFSCGFHDLIKSVILPDCITSHCLFPQTTFVTTKGLNDSFSLITKAIDLNLKILQSTKNDTALFVGYMLLFVNQYNENMALTRPCILNHPALKLPKRWDTETKDRHVDVIDRYNEFIKYHAQVLGCSPWDLQDTCRNAKDNGPSYADDLYNFTPYFYEIRKKRAMELCEELILTLSSQPEDHHLHKFVAKDSISTESILVSDPITPSIKPEVSDQLTVSTTVLPKPSSLVVRNVKYEQIVIITDVRYLPFLQHLNQDQVTIMAYENFDIETLEKYLPSGRNHVTRTTLYLLVLGIHSITETGQASACKRANCNKPMPIIKSLPKENFMYHVEKFVKNLHVALKKVQQSLPNNSSIGILPPLPITLLPIVHNHERYHHKHAQFPLCHLSAVLKNIFKTYPIWMIRMFNESSSSLNACGIEHQKEFDYLNIDRYSTLNLYVHKTKKKKGTQHTYDDWKCFAFALIKKIFSSMNNLDAPVSLMDVNVMLPDNSSSSSVLPPVKYNRTSTYNSNLITVGPANGFQNSNLPNLSEANLLQNYNILSHHNPTIESRLNSVPNINEVEVSSTFKSTINRDIDSIIKFICSILHSSNILQHQGISCGPSGFDNVLLVGSRELICPLAECNAKSSMICFEVTNFDENDLENLLYEIGDSQEKSVCCLVFDISIITTKLMSSGCLKNSCRQPLFVTALRTENSRAMEEIEQSIAHQLQNILLFIKRLSKYIHVIVLPLFPTRIYCEQVTSLYHHTNHIINNLGSHVVYGSESLWKRAVTSLMLGWNNVIKLVNEKYDSGNFISCYIESNPSSFLILNNVADFNEYWNEPDIWKAFAEILFQSLVPMKINHKYNSLNSWSDKVSVVVKQVSSALPSAYFKELFNSIDPDANIIYQKDQYTLNGMTFGRANLLVEKLNNYRIGDTVLFASILQQTGLIVTEFNLMQKLYNMFNMDKVYLKWKPQIIKDLAENIKQVFNVTTLKTSRCMLGSGCKGIDLCIYYHSPADKRRNPMLHSYTDVLCANIKKMDDICRRDAYCQFSHNVYEIKFHPSKYQIRPCPSGETSEICNSLDGFCNYAHINSPEMFFTPHWEDMNVIGPQLSLKFFIGAIRTAPKIPYEQRNKMKLILISTSSEFLETALTVSCELIKSLGKRMGWKVCSLNNSPRTIASCHVLAGLPCQLANLDMSKLGQLNGAIIFDDIRSIVKNYHHSSYLIEFFQMVKRSKNSNLNKVFVSSSQDSESSRAISELVGSHLKLVNLSNLSNTDCDISDSSSITIRRPFFAESSASSQNESNRCLLRLFDEYNFALEEMRLEFEHKFQRYRINPSAYPKIGFFVDMYNKQLEEQSSGKGDKGTAYRKKMWRQWWDKKFEEVKRLEWELAQRSLVEEFEQKLHQRLPLFEEYNFALEEMRQDFEHKFQKYRIIPRTYPKIEFIIDMFNKQRRDQSSDNGNKNAVYEKTMWREYWSSKFEEVKRLEWESAQKSLIEEFEWKLSQRTCTSQSMARTSYSTELGQSYSFDGTLSLLERMCDDFDFLGPSIEAMITTCRKLGSTTNEAYEIFVQSENMLIVNLVLEKIKTICMSATGQNRVLYERAIDWIPNLLEEAQWRFRV